MEISMVFGGQKKYSRGWLCRRGAALLLFLIAVAILAILYVIQMEAFFGPVARKRPAQPEHRPWLQEDLIVPSEKLIKPPQPPKPMINEPITLSANVRLDESDRGTAVLEFAVSGEVGGNWHCEYSHKGRGYQYDADFKGNIDASKTYSERGVTDESMLYFITKGTYKQACRNTEAGTETSEAGLVYVTGWLCPDYSVNGLVTITTDRSWSASYTLKKGPKGTVRGPG